MLKLLDEHEGLALGQVEKAEFPNSSSNFQRVDLHPRQSWFKGSHQTEHVGIQCPAPLLQPEGPAGASCHCQLKSFSYEDNLLSESFWDNDR